MGRRPLTGKRGGKAPTATSKAKVKGPSGGVKKQPERSNLSSKQANLRSLKQISHLETKEALPETQNISADPPSVTKEKKQIALTGSRRSQRRLSAATPQEKDLKHITEEITITESEKDEEPLNQEVGKLPEPVYKNLEEQVQYLLQQSKEQDKTIEALNFKIASSSSPTTDSPKAADIRYKELYFESQEKIKALEDENHQLALKLERALGKLEAYEAGANIFSENFGKMKDMILFTNLARTDAALNFTSPALPPAIEAAAEAKTTAKRKKNRGSK